jgi:hypothetical protein
MARFKVMNMNRTSSAPFGGTWRVNKTQCAGFCVQTNALRDALATSFIAVVITRIDWDTGPPASGSTAAETFAPQH